MSGAISSIGGEVSGSGSAPPSVRIFISYRRDDSKDIAGRIYDRLAGQFGGAEFVFRDVDSIEPGRPYDEAIDDAIGSCDVFVLLIGPSWLTAVDDRGRRRLDDPKDWHRKEIEVALRRRLRTFPVLLEGARMPAAEELPRGIRKLEKIQARTIVGAAFDECMERLILTIRKAAALGPVSASHDAASPAPIPPPDPVVPRDPLVVPPPVAVPAEPEPPGLFAAATPLSGERGSVSGDNTDATREPGEPEHAGRTGGRSVWFRWTAPGDAAVMFDTVGSEFDTLLAVYRGTSLDELEPVAANDDAEGTASRVRFPVSAGEEYAVAVDGYGGAAGAFVLNWELQPPPANDAFLAAEEIAGARGSAYGDTLGATREPDEPDHAGRTGGRSVWFRWTAPDDGAVTFDTAGSDFDTLLAVYRGTSLDELEQVAANDDADGRTSRVRFPVAAGNEYAIAVDGYSGAWGRFVLNWSTQLPLVDLVRATGLSFTEFAEGVMSVPFRGERAEQVTVNGREVGDGVAFFCVDLPEFAGFGSGTILKGLLGLTYGAEFVKAIALSGGRYALAAELPLEVLDPFVCEGVIRSLVALGDVKGQSDLINWSKRLDHCRQVQERHGAIDPDTVRAEVRALLVGAGLVSGGGYELTLGFETLPLSVFVNQRAVSLAVTLQGSKPGGDKQKLNRLLELNRIADVAKVGLAPRGEVVFLYEVPRVFPQLVECMRRQFLSLQALVEDVV